MKIARAMALMLAAGGLPAGADDRWEVRSDDNAGTNNELQPDVVQLGHDVEKIGEIADVDWYKVRTQPRHSYEARVFGGGVVWVYETCSTCAVFDRVAGDGTVLTPGTTPGVIGGGALSVRWMADAQVDLLRVEPRAGATGYAIETYDVLLVDTTLFLPRFNNVGAQRTVLILQNTRERSVGGRIDFRDEAGALVHTQPFDVPAYGSLVLDTSSLAPVAGRSGSALIAHTGGQGAFTGKGVSLEPSTGFTFDTAITTAPR
jgi:hypothetical protein